MVREVKRFKKGICLKRIAFADSRVQQVKGGLDGFGTSVGGAGTVLGPLLVVSGCSCGLCWRSGAALEPLRAVLGHSWGLCWRSWAALEALWAVVGRSWGPCWLSWAVLGLLRVVLGRSWGLYGRKIRRTWLLWTCAHFSSGSAICGLGGGPVPLLDLLLAVLGRSWGPRWRSWAGLGAYVGGLGASWGRRGRSWAYISGWSWDGSGPKSGPNPS